MKNNKSILKGLVVYEHNPLQSPESETLVAEDTGKVLVLYNDDYNTFDHVIKCLVEICDHDGIQAEQCAYIVHYNGKCEVLHAEDEKLDMCCRLLQLKGLSATIE